MKTDAASTTPEAMCSTADEGRTADLLTEVLVEAESYRCLALEAVGALHQLQRRHDRLRERYNELLKQFHRPPL